jgi:uncharacterized protein YbjT (DUF2867 family)
MRVFVTGATGFIGTELVKELIAAGHQVRGLTRSDAGVEQLKAAGVEVHRGDLQDLDSLCRGATGMDAAVNLAFNHDFPSSHRTGSPASSEWTRKTLGWEPTGPGLIEDLKNMKY